MTTLFNKCDQSAPTSPVKHQPRRVLERPVDLACARNLLSEGASPLLARTLASRNIGTLAKLNGQLKYLHHHSLMHSTREAAQFLADAIERERPMVIVADYDCDGATACTVGLRGLRNFGAKVDYVVPDRMVHGYGLTPGVVDLALERFPDAKVLITVDNGIASHAGVDAARKKGLEVLVTDHHLPATGKSLPPANVIVNPSQPACTFPTRALAGVGVIWYVLWALQDLLRERGHEIPAERRVSTLLPLVAVGTVADVVPLDENNRILVQAGLARIREGKSFAGIEALATVGFGNRTRVEELLTSDIAFGIGPRINAAGRLETMDVGIECLMEDDPERARSLAEALNKINLERKTIEQRTADEALEQACEMVTDGTYSIVVHGPDWHPGVIGIVAGRLKEQRWRPTFVLATDPKTGEVKGSGRSIPGFNIKDALDQVDKAEPGLLLRFGGHAMAAGVTIAPDGFDRFRDAFENQTRLLLDESLLAQELMHDGSLSCLQLSVDAVKELSQAPWGHMFTEPAFCDEFKVLDATLTGPAKDQLQMKLEREGIEIAAVRFRHFGEIPAGSVRLIYKLSRRRDRWGNESLQLLVDHIL